MGVRVEDDEVAQAIYEEVGWCPDCEAFCVPGVRSLEFGARCPDCAGERALGAIAAARGGFIDAPAHTRGPELIESGRDRERHWRSAER